MRTFLALLALAIAVLAFLLFRSRRKKGSFTLRFTKRQDAERKDK